MDDQPAGRPLPDRLTPARLLAWLIVSQRRRCLTGAFFATTWLVGLSLVPYLLSRAVDQGLRTGRAGPLVAWSAGLVGLALLNALLGVMRHRTMTQVRMDGFFRTARTVLDHATRLGAALPRQVGAGEVVTIGVADVRVIGTALTFTGPGVGAVLACLFLTGLLLSVSAQLALVVLIGVPLTAALAGPLLGRQQGATAAYREAQATLTARFTDIAGGLRVLSGFGGQEVYAERYRRDSAEVLRRGYRLGATSSWVECLAQGMPAFLLAAVTWLAARLALQGTITIGQLVAVYGYVAVLIVPVGFLFEGGTQITAGLVAAGRVCRFLTLRPDPAGDPARHGPDGPAALRDPDSGVEIAPGRLTALVSARPAESAAVVDRLGRFAPSAATWGADRLTDVHLPRVRERILVADNEADLFAGTLRELLSGRADPDAAALTRAVGHAAAADVLRGLAKGFDARIDAQGRNLSGGQRQRLRMARALLAEPEVLLAVEPTSAVDAHTEAAMAAGLREARQGRTTVVTTSSPLLLDRADVVCHLVDGRVAATGTHRELLAAHPGYRALVARGEGDAEDDPGERTAGGAQARPPGPSAVHAAEPSATTAPGNVR